MHVVCVQTHTHTDTHNTHTHTFVVPRQEPGTRDIDGGSWESIGPAGVQVEGPVTHQAYSRGQQSQISDLSTVVVVGGVLTCGGGCVVEVVQALVPVAAPLLLHLVQGVS